MQPDKKMKESKWGETLHLTKRKTKEEQAALIIQTKFRRRVATKRAAIRKRVQAKNLLAFRDAIRKMNRRYWRQIDLKSLSRVELEDGKRLSFLRFHFPFPSPPSPGCGMRDPHLF